MSRRTGAVFLFLCLAAAALEHAPDEAFADLQRAFEERRIDQGHHIAAMDARIEIRIELGDGAGDGAVGGVSL